MLRTCFALAHTIYYYYTILNMTTFNIDHIVYSEMIINIKIYRNTWKGSPRLKHNNN